MAGTKQSGAPRRAFKTKLKRKRWNGQPVSVDYLRFCSKEIVSKKHVWYRDYCIIHQAAFHGHLPLLQELLKPLKELPYNTIKAAGESSFSQPLRLLCYGF